MTPLTKDTEDNIERFFTEVIASEVLWGLEGPDGWALCPAEGEDDTDVMPFWSQREFAEPHCEGDWSEYRPTAIALEEFLDDWLPGLDKDGLLVGVNWDEELEGVEIAALDLLEDFAERLD
jgi:hypothetical protein